MCPRRSDGLALLMAIARLVDYSQREQQRKIRARNGAAYRAPTRVLMSSGSEGIEQIDNMDGASFEYYVAGLLQRNGFQNVRVTKESGDYGVDVIGYKNGVSYAFQCKCYHGSVGVRAVQEISAGAAFYNLQEKVVITNSYFSKNAHIMAQRLGVQLWDRATLMRLMQSQSVVKPKDKQMSDDVFIYIAAAICILIFFFVVGK